MNDPTATIARFVCELMSLPDEIVELGEMALIDYLGVAAIGAVEPDIAPLREYASNVYRSGHSTALGVAKQLTAPGAAYVNGTAGHVLDYDDFHDTPGAHPTAVILPALLALAEERRSTVAEILTAYVAGVEVMCALGRALNHTHYERGWHPSATLGVLAATAASARLVRLGPDLTANALGIAASFSSGLKGNFGTSMKSTQVGHAAANAVQASMLAERGASANPTILSSGPGSFAGAFNAGTEPTWSALEALGHTWEIQRPGLVFKLYPCCGSTHAAIDAARRLRDASGLSSGELTIADLVRIEIRTHPRRLPHTDLPRPESGLGAKFSIQYCVARALLGSSLNHRDFDDDAATAADVQPLLAIVDAGPLEESRWVRPEGRADCFATSVAVETSSGARIEEFAVGPKGFDASDPATRAEIDTKFIDNLNLLVGSGAKDVLAAITDWLNGVAGAPVPLARINAAVLEAAVPSRPGSPS